MHTAVNSAVSRSSNMPSSSRPTNPASSQPSSSIDQRAARERAVVRLRKEKQEILDALADAVKAVGWPCIPDYSTEAATKRTNDMFPLWRSRVKVAREPFFKQLEKWEENLSPQDREYLLPTEEEIEAMWEQVGDNHHAIVCVRLLQDELWPRPSFYPSHLALSVGENGLDLPMLSKPMSLLCALDQGLGNITE